MKEEKSTKLAVIDSNTGIDKYGQSWKDRVLSHPERTIRVGTAFSGIGAPEMALNQLGIKHEIVFACDINKSAKKSYLANYDVTDWWDDVKELDATRYMGMIDLFVAGVCCQPWSLAGKLKGLDDERGQLFYQFVRVICECAPKVWIFENVDNILRHTTEMKNGEEVLTWSILLNDMETKFKEAGLNYHLHYRVLDAADYGIPQHRERVFCIGFLDEDGNGKDDFLFPAPIKLEKGVYDYLDDLTPGVKVLTARERVRLMGFPDSFKQVVSDSQLSKQSGNSIVVDVMMALYKQMDITKYGIAA